MSDAQTPISVLPPLYGRWVDALLGGPIPAETDATCDDCAMCPKGETATSAGTQFFDPGLQCCTYFPDLPNFLVGRILNDPDFAGSVVHRMVAGGDVQGELITPLGIRPPAKYSILYQSRMMSFGNDASLRCPFHVDGTDGRGPSCGIWRHRQSMCTTWYCKFVRGMTGSDFWADLHKLLKHMEKTLEWWCVLDFDFDPETLRHLAYLQMAQAGRVEVPPQGRLDCEVSGERYRALWCEWRGREAEFYVECARRVETLSWEDIRAIGGSELELHSRLVQSRYADLISTELPARLRAGAYQVLHAGPQSTTVISYSPLDPIELPGVLLQLLPYFDGREVTESLAAIQRDHTISISPGLVQKLVDYGILVPA